MTLIRTVLDFETAYGKHPVTGENITLSKMTTEEYIRHIDFKVYGLGVKVNADSTFYVHGEDMVHFLRTHPWGQSCVVCHHSHFDVAILTWRANIRPKFIGCTLSMARALFPAESKSLDSLGILLGIGRKGTELAQFAGKWDLTEEEQGIMGGYCINDVDLTSEAFDRMVGQFSMPELRLIDLTVRMFTEPCIVIDQPVLQEEYTRGVETKKKLIIASGVLQPTLSSNVKFAQALMQHEVDPPKKLSPSKVKDGRVDPDNVGEKPLGILPTLNALKGATPEEKKARAEQKRLYPWAYAFGKADEEFIRLLEHPDTTVQKLVEARLAVKSTIKETRSKRFMDIGSRGEFPVYLNYFGAKTGRWSGGDAQNAQNMTRVYSGDPTSGALRRSWTAPEGHLFAVRDSGQIECLSEGTKVLTSCRGYVKIQHIHRSDLLWDGVEWVQHDGVVCTGEKEVITHDGITATSDHIVYTAYGRRVQLSIAEAEGTPLAVGERGGDPVRYVEGTLQANPVGWESSKSMVSMHSERLCERSISSCRRSARREVNQLRGAQHGEQVLPDTAQAGGEGVAAEVQPDTRSNEPTRYKPRLCFLQEAENTEQVLICGAVHTLHGGERAPYDVSRSGDRPNRKRGGLCPREFAATDQTGKCAEAALQPQSSLERGGADSSSVHQEVLPKVSCLYSGEDDSQWGHTSADDSTPDGEATGGNVVKVYDIINSGPRHRFTANGKIVSNCRKLAYVAGQEDMIQMFIEGGDPYNRQASLIFNKEVDRKLPEFQLEGMVGKSSTLGCGFGQGWASFQENLRKGFMGAPPVLFTKQNALDMGVTLEAFCFQRSYKKGCATLKDQALKLKPLNLTDETHLWHCVAVKGIVDGYRASNPMVTALWKEADYALMAILTGQEIPLGQHGMVSTYKGGLCLPNKIRIQYPQITKGKDGYKYCSNVRRREWSKLYGALVVENLTQALARIVVADQMLRVRAKLQVQAERKKSKIFKVVHMLHDEIITIVPEYWAEECLHMMEIEMAIAPAWCSGLPLKSSGGFGKNYGACEH